MLRRVYLVLFSYLGFFCCSCSEGFLVAAIDLNRPGGSGEPPLPFCSQRVWFFLRLVPRAAPAVVPRLRDEGRFGLEKGGLIAAFTVKVNSYFYFFGGHSLSQDSVQKGTPLGASP